MTFITTELLIFIYLPTRCYYWKVVLLHVFEGCLLLAHSRLQLRLK